MLNVIRSIRASKKEHLRHMQRVSNLPEDYRFVYQKIQDYIWSFAGGSGMDMLKTQYDLLDLFESGAIENKHVLEITGKDVASFCDNLIQDNTLWTKKLRKRLNHKINKKLNHYALRK